MTPIARALTIAAVAVVAGCGAERSDPRYAPENVPACGASGYQPPSRLILHPGNAIPGRWLVRLRDEVVDPAPVARDLAAKYGGAVTATWQQPPGFGIEVDDSKAEPLSLEPQVCYVEQDGVVSGNGGPQG